VCVLALKQDWFHQHKPSVAPHFRPFVPGTVLSVWYNKLLRVGRENTMWTLWFVYYMHVEKLYAVYSNLYVYTNITGNCLSVNRREPGLHFRRKGRANLDCLLTVWKEEYIRFPHNIVRLHWDGSPMGKQLY